MPSIENPLTKKLATVIEFTEVEQNQLSNLQERAIKIAKGEVLLQEGLSEDKMYIVQSGWTSMYKDLPNGERQIINFALPGDCVGLRSIFLKKSDHSFEALTAAQISSVGAGQLLRLFDDHPRIRDAFLWSAAREESMIVQRLTSLGRRSAIERIAYFFLELLERLTLVGLAGNAEFKCPLSQSTLADALGLTAIHVNRIMRQLQERKLMTARYGKVVIHDPNELGILAGYHAEHGPPLY